MKKEFALRKLTSGFLVTVITTLVSQSLPAYASEEREMKLFPKEMLEKPVHVKEREREEHRDKFHDNRFKIDKDTSIGIGSEGINLRRSFLIKLVF